MVPHCSFEWFRKIQPVCKFHARLIFFFCLLLRAPDRRQPGPRVWRRRGRGSPSSCFRVLAAITFTRRCNPRTFPAPAPLSCPPRCTPRTRTAPAARTSPTSRSGSAASFTGTGGGSARAGGRRPSWRRAPGARRRRSAAPGTTAAPQCPQTTPGGETRNLILLQLFLDLTYIFLLQYKIK